MYWMCVKYGPITLEFDFKLEIQIPYSNENRCE